MEQIVKSILKQQGIDRIGLFDQNNDIWVYAKDDEVHFCKSDLAPIDRKTIGIDQELIVLTETEDTFHIVKDKETFPNFVAIDKNNKILAQAHHLVDQSPWQTKYKFQIDKFGKNSFIIVTKINIESCVINKPKLLYINSFGNRESYTFIDSNYMKDYCLCSIYKDIIFFRNNNNIVAYEKRKGKIYEGKSPYLWVHEDGEAQLLLLENDPYIEDDKIEGHQIRSGFVGVQTLNDNRKVSYRVSDYIYPKDIQNDNTEINIYNNQLLFSDKYIVLPFLQRYGAFVIGYEKNDNVTMSAHTIIFGESFNNTSLCKYNFSFYDKIIKIEEVVECSDYHNEYNYFFYDVDGNRIKSDDNNISHMEGLVGDVNNNINDDSVDYGSDYTQEELDDMYRAAFEGDPEAQWNID